jgi:hypothetical protein
VKIPGLFAGIKRDHLLGFVWFDEAEHGGVYHQNWRRKDHPAILAAFRRAVTLRLAVAAFLVSGCGATASPSRHPQAHEAASAGAVTAGGRRCAGGQVYVI